MKLAYLVDTDWIIDQLNRKAEVNAKLKELRPSGVGISIVSVAELFEGVYYSKDPVKSQAMLDFVLSAFPTVSIDVDVCKVFGKERGRLRREKKTVDDFDLLIASTCLHWNLTLLSNNRKHYELIKGLNIISLP